MTTASAHPLLHVDDLTVAFGTGEPVVRGVSFDVAPGECFAIVGESGSGKSVTARTLLGLAGATAQVSAAALELGGKSVLANRDRDWRRVRGREVAGRVEAVGQAVTTLAVGDEVFGIADGSFAGYVSARPDKLVPRPANLPVEQAAAVSVSALTALQAVRDRGHLQAGQKVLVIGASGGVGTFAVQIAKAFGAEVTGVCSTAKTDLVLSIGADHVTASRSRTLSSLLGQHEQHLAQLKARLIIPPGATPSPSPPAASGPASSAASSAASCCSSSRHCAACPREASPASPLACQACRHRRTDRSLTRSSAAITAAGTRCSNLLAASSRTCSRRLRPSAVSPPPCAYLMHLAYRPKRRMSASGHHQLKVF